MSGLSVGMFLFLVSVGMSLIFGVPRIVNLAHGSFYMVGAYLMVTVVELLPERPWSFWLALLVAPLGVALLGGIIEVSLLRLIYRRDPLMQLILTFGLILVIGTLVLLVWGPDNKSVPRPEALAGSVKILGQPFPAYYVLVLALAPLVAGALWLVFYRTRWGMLVRAATVDREMLGALGVNVAALYTQVFVFGSGLGSFAGSFIGALLVGLLQSFGILIFPAVSIVLIFAIMAVVLIVRPWGLLGRPEE